MNRVYVDVDTQFDFCDPNGALFVHGAVEAVANAKTLIDTAVRSGAVLVGSVDSHSHDAWEFATNDNRGPNGEKPGFPAHCVKGTPGWLKLPVTLPERFYFVSVTPDETAAVRVPAGTQAVYFEKEVYSLFANPNAARVLDAIVSPGPIEVIVFGVATDYCVRAAAEGFLSWFGTHPKRFGSRVVVASDAVAAVTADGGETAIKALCAAGVALVTTAGILRAE